MQRLETFQGEAKKRFMLHYNFPPFSVGEVQFLRGAGTTGDWTWGARGAGRVGGAADRREVAVCDARGL